MKDNKVTRRAFFQKTFLYIPVPIAISTLLTSCTASKTVVKADGIKLQKTGDTDFQALQKLLANKKPLKWVFSGDSITQGAKHTNGFRAYSEVFSERIRWEMGRGRDVIINTAISGHTSLDILNDYDWRIGQFNPQIVSIMIGTNDANNQKVPLNIFQENLTKLVTKARELGAIPILQTPNIIIEDMAPERAKLSEYVKVICKVSEEHNVVLIDHWQYWKKAMETDSNNEVHTKWLKDPLHPSGYGHLELARFVFKTLSIFDAKSFTCSGKIQGS